jgi:general secretion pathway protein N
MNSIPRSAWIATLAIVSGLALLMLMPLAVAANALGVTARNVQGSILSGAIRDASLGGVRIGDVNARMRILPLFLGRLSFSLMRGDTPYVPGVSGAIGTGWGGIFADKLTATIDGGGLVRGMDGSEIRIESLSFAFANGKCSTASGVVRLSLDETALGSVLRGGMLGNAQCSNGDLYVPLLSQSTMERASIRIKGDGSYQATFTINQPSPENAVALAFAGFKPVAGGFRLMRTGTLN